MHSIPPEQKPKSVIPLRHTNHTSQVRLIQPSIKDEMLSSQSHHTTRRLALAPSISPNPEHRVQSPVATAEQPKRRARSYPKSDALFPTNVHVYFYRGLIPSFRPRSPPRGLHDINSCSCVFLPVLVIDCLGDIQHSATETLNLQQGSQFLVPLQQHVAAHRLHNLIYPRRPIRRSSTTNHRKCRNKE